MALRALTLDFWNTMVVARSNSARRQRQRYDHLLHIVRAYRPEATEETVRTAHREATRLYDASLREWATSETLPLTQKIGIRH